MTEVSTCPACGSSRFALHEDRPGQCFDLRCGLRALDPGTAASSQVFELIYKQSHKALTEAADDGSPRSVVNAHSMVGVVPEDLDLAQLWAPHIETAQQRLTAAQSALGSGGRPSKQKLAEVQSAQAGLDGLSQLSTDAKPAFDNAAGARVFFYTNATHHIVRVCVCPQDQPERVIGAGGLFNHGLFAATPKARGTELVRRSLLLVSHPEDALAIQALGIARALDEGLAPERGYLWCAALGDHGGLRSMRDLTRKPVLLVGENPAGQALVTAARQLANLHVCHPPTGVDVRTWLAQDGVSWPSLEAQFGSRHLVTRPYERVREDLDFTRQLEGRVKKFEVERWTGESLARDLEERGTLYHDGQTAYVFLQDTKEIVPVDIEHPGWRKLAHQFGVAPTDSLAKPWCVSLTMRAEIYGTRAAIYPFVHYDRARQAIYMSNLGEVVYRITANSVDAVDNGTDGKLFVRSPKWMPFDLQLGIPAVELPSVTDRLLGAIHFGEGHLLREEVVHLFRLWLLGMCVPELFPTRPILAMIGPKGSGKTSSLELLGTLLFGPAFKVADLTEDARDFDAALTSEFFVVADNADRDLKWLPDKLAVVATGGTIKRRAYYTTNSQVEFPLKACLAISSRTPHFRREDVADRLLPLHVERFSGFAPLSDLKASLVSDRNLLLTALVRDLQKVLRALQATAGQKILTSFRMGDFGAFAIRTGSALGFAGDTEGLLKRLGQEQLQFATRNEPLFEFLTQWLTIDANSGRELTTGELFVEMMNISSAHDSAFPWRTPQEFGHVVDSFRATLESLFQMTERSGHAGVKRVRFHRAAAAESAGTSQALRAA